jgi:hypothetical protein
MIATFFHIAADCQPVQSEGRVAIGPAEEARQDDPSLHAEEMPSTRMLHSVVS